MRSSTHATLTALALAGLTMPCASADTYIIDFDSYVHGQILSTQEPGVTISAINRGGGPDLAVVFDSRERQTRDPDLEGPNGVNGSWSGGNIGSQTILGGMLIIQENSIGIQDGIADYPDDEGSRPAGSLIFQFHQEITSFGFDLIDVEGVEEYGKDSGYFATFFGVFSTVRISFADLVTNITPFYDPTIEFGDHHANRIQPITAASLGLESFNKVEINFGGSAAVDNITYTTPGSAIPTPTAFAGAALLGVMLMSRSVRRHLGSKPATV